MNPTAYPDVAPVSQSERIVILDSLRGIALLGILLMNIPYFGLPDPAADNLTVLRELGTINYQVWHIITWIFDGTQRAIFSMLFGTGVILFISRLEKRTEGMAPAEYFIRRQLWLLVFGLFNGYVLLWGGDILFAYALVGIIVFAFRKLQPKYLWIAAGICLILMTARENLDLYRTKHTISQGETIARLDTTKVRLTEKQKDELSAMTELKTKEDSVNLKNDMARNLRQFRGTWPEIYSNVSSVTLHFELIEAYYDIWDILIFMLIGMALFKTGILTGNAPFSRYAWLSIIGLGLGLLLTHIWLEPIIRYRFNMFLYSKNVLFDYYEISRTFRSLGIFGLIMMMYKSGWFNWLFSLARPVGQMAFTNYLMQSLLCGLFFYGVGLGMYGKLERYQLYFVVAAVWIIEIVWSHIWLRYFRFGPLEWLWRSLTYWKRQPLRRQN